MGSLKWILCSGESPCQNMVVLLLYIVLDSLVVFQFSEHRVSLCSPDSCDTAELLGTTSYERKKSPSEFTSLAAVCSLYSFSNDQRAFAVAAASPDCAE